MNRSLNQVVDEIRVWAAAHVQVNEMAYGSIVDIYNRNEITHCIVAVNCNNASVETNWVDLSLEVAVFDRVDAPSVDYGKRPQHEVESDTLQIINDLRKTIEYADRWKDWSELISASGAQKYVEHTSDAVTGWMMTMNVRVYSQPGVCDLPLIAYDYGGEYSAVCAPVRIFENGVLVETVASGGTYSYTTGGGGSVDIEVNGVEFTTVEAPDTFNLPVIQDGSPVGSKVGSDWVVPSCADADWTLKDTSGDTLNSGSIASGGSEDITAPDANYSLNNTDGTELSTGVIESGGSETIVAPDAQVFSNNTAGSLPGTTNVPSGAFTNITYPDASVTVDDQDGNELAQQDVPSGVSSTIVVTIPEYDLSIPQAPLTVDIDENKTLTIRDSAGNSFLSSQVSASEVVNDVFVDLADYKATVQGLTPNIYNVLRTDSPSFRLFDTDGTQISIDSIDDSANPIFDVTLANIPLQVNSGVEGALKLGWDVFNIILEDPSGATVTPDSIDTGTAKQVTIEVPALALDVSLAVDDTNPTVGEEITATVTASGADSFCVSFDNGTSVAGTSATANNTYMIPGVYTVGALAGIDATGVGGAVPDASKVDVTVDGILDTYATSAFIATAPVLLQRLYAGDGLEVRKTGPGGTSDFGYTDGVLDDFTTYVGSGDGFVRTLYNQVGNDFVQTNNADQPQIINSGTLYTNPFGGWVMRFNNNEYLQATREDFWPVGDRTKLFMAFAFSCNDGTNATQILLSQFEYSTGNNRCFRTWYDGVDEEINVQYSTDGTNTTYQTINFSGVSLNEFAVVIVQIDTSETVNDRIKAWKFDESGETSLTREGTTGNQSGNLYNSTADVLIGAQNPSNPAALFTGDISPHLILTPQLISDVNRDVIGQYMYDCIADGL